MASDFNALFDEWSNTYDETVIGHDPEYNEVFRSYDHILNEVAEKAEGFVIEFGVGTGNLTEKLINSGKEVYGIEPSKGMRKVAKAKLAHIDLVAGDFLQFLKPSRNVNTIVSTYAFHHLTDDEKERAIGEYSHLLGEGGKVVFADTIFEDELIKRAMITDAESKGFHRLANDLRTEFYTTIPILRDIFIKHGFTVSFTQKNAFVWLIEAVKER